MVTTSRWRLGLRERIQGISRGMVDLNPASIFLNLRRVIDCTRVCTTSSIPDEVGHHYNEMIWVSHLDREPGGTDPVTKELEGIQSSPRSP
jgi:hypothetical protein